MMQFKSNIPITAVRPVRVEKKVGKKIKPHVVLISPQGCKPPRQA